MDSSDGYQSWGKKRISITRHLKPSVLWRFPASLVQPLSLGGCLLQRHPYRGLFNVVCGLCVLACMHEPWRSCPLRSRQTPSTPLRFRWFHRCNGRSVVYGVIRLKCAMLRLTAVREDIRVCCTVYLRTFLHDPHVISRTFSSLIDLGVTSADDLAEIRINHMAYPPATTSGRLMVSRSTERSRGAALRPRLTSRSGRALELIITHKNRSIRAGLDPEL